MSIKTPQPSASPAPSPKPSGNLGPSAEAEKAAASAPQGDAGVKAPIGLTGVPKGTQILTGQEPKLGPKGRPTGRTKPSYGATQYVRNEIGPLRPALYWQG